MLVHPTFGVMALKKLFLLLCLVLCSVLQGQAKEITLFNSDGEAVAYIDDSDSDPPLYMGPHLYVGRYASGLSCPER